MDQVKEYLAVAAKHAFWIGSGIVLLGALGIWFVSTSDLNKQTDDQIRSIESNVQKVSTYRSELPTQPNDFSHKIMEDFIEERKGEVLVAWNNVFDAQRDILTWPEVMQEEFLDEFKFARNPETGLVDKNRLKLPFEKFEEHGVESESGDVNPALLRRYEQYIGEVLPDYAKIAKAKWTADFEKVNAGGMMGGMLDDGGMGEMMGGLSGGGRGVKVDITGSTGEPVVKWSAASQEAVLKDLFPWRGSKPYPSELDVYYSQENLWILKQLLQIVATVNGDARQAFEAKIREIKSLQIGKSVKFDAGQISAPGSTAKGGFGGMMGGMGDMGGMMDGMGEMGGDMYAEGGLGGGGIGGEEEIGEDPGDGRYVDTEFEPITASALRGAFTSNSPDEVKIAVAKRLPVMLRLQMDQRSLPKLLAVCGSVPLRVEVHQVRMMPKGAASAAGGMGGGMDEMGGMGGGMDEMGGPGMGMGMGMGMGGMGGGGGGASRGGDDEFSLDVDVEIYGLIYFYNPPSEESLGIEKVTADTNIEEPKETVDALPVPNVDTTTTPAEDTTPPAAGTPSSGAPSGGGATDPAGSPSGPGTQPSNPGGDPNSGATPADAGPPAGTTAMAPPTTGQ